MYATPHASVIAGGSLLAGAFMRNVQTLLTSPAEGGTNTSGTISLQAKALDPFRRTQAVQFVLDQTTLYNGPSIQTSPNVTVQGWADTAAAWVSAPAINGTWYFKARATLTKVGAGPSTTGRYSTSRAFIQAGGAGIPRSLYVYVNKGIEGRVAAVAANARTIYVYVNKAIWPRIPALGTNARDLYLVVNQGIVAVPGARDLYLYVAQRDGEVFPYLNHINPTEQYVLGQVDLYGDGFGQFLDASLPVAPAITVSSTNGGNIPGNAMDRTAAEWQSTSGAAAWIRFTWGAAKRIVAVVLEGSRLPGNSWGTPRFRFDDASSQDGTVGVSAPGHPATVTEYPVGPWRQIYWLATPKVSTYVEVAIASGGVGTNRGFSEVWVIEEAVPPQAAETSRAVLNLGLPSEQTMGIVAWLTRSPNWYPANSGIAPLPAATVTVPSGAVSGLVYVEETT